MRKLSLYLFLVAFVFTRGQTRSLDSLKNELKKGKQDTSHVKLLNKIASEYRSTKPDTSVIISTQALRLAEKLNWKKGIARSYHLIGSFYWKCDNNSLALVNDLKALNEWEQLLAQNPNDESLQNNKSATLGNLGLVCQGLGNYTKALMYYLEALKIGEKLNDKVRVEIQLGNLGNLCHLKGDYSAALNYFSKALEMAKSNDDKYSYAIYLGNMGNTYFALNNYSKALGNYLMAYKINTEIDNKQDLAINLTEIGNVYFMELKKQGLSKKQKDSLFKKSLDFQLKALKINEELGLKSTMGINYGNLGSMYYQQNNLKEAEKYMLKAQTMSAETGDLYSLKNWKEDLSKIYSEKGDWKSGLLTYREFVKIKDSLFNEEVTKNNVQAQMQYDFDKKTAADSIRKSVLIKQEKLKHDNEINQHKMYSIGGAIGFVLMVVIAAILYNAFRQKKKANLIIAEQKQEVERQKDLVDEKQKEVLDSITYAKRLQDAILPPSKLVNQEFPESFVLYKPKDIVAGDFYWLEKLGNTTLMAAADCTGHGVPGAMVSVVCSNALNRAVKEFKLIEPGKILDKVTELVLETFEKSESNISDGMDISLCSFDLKNQEIKWAGANSPLWYITHNELKEITANKQPIGLHDNRTQFTTHTLKLNKGDTVFLFTDGYADQFGGPKGKKFKYKQLESVILSNNQQSMQYQKEALETALENWKGEAEQVDDITVIAIRV